MNATTNATAKTIEELRADETARRLKWENETEAFKVNETKVEGQRVWQEERSVSIAEARLVFDALQAKAGVSHWKDAFRVVVDARVCILAARSVEHFHGGRVDISAHDDAGKVWLTTHGYAC